MIMIAVGESILIAQPMSLTDLTDEALARQARDGDLWALDTLARRWQRPLLRFLERRVPSRTDAEDLFQETFVRICRHLGDFDDRRSFKTWIFTIAWRLAANHLRDRRPSSNPDSLPERPSLQPDPSTPSENEDLHRHLWAIARHVLSDDQYMALWLFYVEDLSPRDIARVLGKSWVATKTSLHRARKSLQPHLAKFERTA